MSMSSEEQDWNDDPILPEQFFGAGADDGPLRGIRLLMTAVLEDAIHCILDGTRPGSNARARIRAGAAIRWMRTEDTTHPFAFDSICDALDLDGSNIRGRIADQVAQHDRQERAPRASFHRVERVAATIRPRRVRRRRGKAAALAAAKGGKNADSAAGTAATPSRGNQGRPSDTTPTRVLAAAGA